MATIEFALKHSDPWKHDASELASIKEGLVAIKARIRNLHMERQGQTCCYCRTNLAGGGAFMVDREHILPKKKFTSLTFAPSNLSVSCKRCNMEYKGDSIDFVYDSATIASEHEDASRYKFVHPNLDRWKEHLSRVSVQEDDALFVKYRVKNNSKKGQYTFRYFRLDLLQIDSLDKAQGLPDRDEDVRGKLHDLAQILGADPP